MSSSDSFLSALLLTLAALHLGGVVLLLADRHTSRPWVALSALVGVVLGSAAAVLVLGADLPTATAAAGASVAVAALGLARRGALSAGGAVVWGSYLALAGTAVVWGGSFLAGLSLGWVSTVLLWAAGLSAALVLPSYLVKTKETWEALIRERWDRPRTPLDQPDRTEWPRVCVQVPCHAEPPEVVMATLDRIAQLDYPNFEVVVVDNNTTNEALWRPLEEHCRRLGDRFRFFHVEGITGAKAGALNWVMPQVDPAATVIAVVDADYQVDPQWLKATVGHLDDERVGFVQCPHAYRDFEHSTFGTWANWEYAAFFKTGMVSLNEHGAGITVGTMSVIRRSAFEVAGGWSEWCLTEDSELAIRIHDRGWTSVYLDEAYGWGLIPETFAAYRKQRFRWTYGPVQELYRHWRHYVPVLLGGKVTPMGWGQRLHHANHGLEVVVVGTRMVGLVLAALGATSMVLHGEQATSPLVLWIVSTVVLAGDWAMRLLTYRRVVQATWKQTLGGVVAASSLMHVMTVASLRAVLGLPAAWQRTDKFRAESRGFAALVAARDEAAIGAALVASAFLLWTTSGGGVAAMVGTALALQSLQYLAAPVVAWVADRDLRRSGEQLAFEVECGSVALPAQLGGDGRVDVVPSRAEQR